MTTAIAIFFVICAAAVVYAYAGYPVVILTLSRLFGRTPQPLAADETPSVTLLVAAHNEEAVIETWIQNALALEYPRLRIVVASDHSTDATHDIVRRWTDRGVRLIENAIRQGKAGVLNGAIAQLDSDIIVLTDANTTLDRAAIGQLVRWFTDRDVVAVCGKLELVDPSTGRNADGMYWKYETFLKRCENRLNAVLGANGAIYAMRRDRFVPVPPGTIVDDFVIPLLSRLQFGGRIVFDSGARAIEETAATVGAEFHRRARIGAGDFQSVGLLWRLLNPGRGWIAFAFLSHKVMRWTCPFFMAGALLSSAVLWRQPVFRAALIAQIGFYALSLILALVPLQWRGLRPLRLTTMFTSMNASLLLGFVRWLRGAARPTWEHASR